MARSILALLLASSLFAAGSCGKSDSSSPTSPSNSAVTSDVVTGLASAEGVAAVYQTADPPNASGGPAATVSGTTTIPAGGSSVLNVSAGSLFDTVYLSVTTGSTSAVRLFRLFDTVHAAQLKGYWQLRLPAPVTQVSVAFELSSGSAVPTNGQFSLDVQVAAPGGGVGTVARQALTMLGPMTDPWHVSLGVPGAGLDVSGCGIVVPGGFSSQTITANANGAFREVWSPKTPVVEVSGTLTSTSLSASFKCANTPQTGSMSATGNGTLRGTATLSGRTVAICVFKTGSSCAP